MSRIKNFFMLSALIIGIGGAIAGTPKQEPDCLYHRFCDDPAFVPITTTPPDCSGQDNLGKCLAADDEGTQCDEMVIGCEEINK
jgi:hypothetical protein